MLQTPYDPRLQPYRLRRWRKCPYVDCNGRVPIGADNRFCPCCGRTIERGRRRGQYPTVEDILIRGQMNAATQAPDPDRQQRARDAAWARNQVEQAVQQAQQRLALNRRR